MYILEAGEGVFLLRFFPDGRRLLAGVAAADKTVSFDVWTLPDGGRVRLGLPPRLKLESWWYSGYGNAVAVHPDGERCYVAWDGRLYAFRTADGTPLPVPKDVKAHQVILSPDGGRMLAAYVTPSRKQLYALRTGGEDGAVERRPTPQTFWQLGGFLPDGERVVMIHDSVRVVTFATGEEHAAVRYPAGHAYQPQVSPDGRYFGVIGYSSFYVYDLPDLGKPRRLTSTRSSGDYVSFAFHPGGRALAVIHGGPTLVKVYDPATLRPLHTFKWKLGPLGAVAYSPDGALAAAGSQDGRIVVWDVDE
ncbi:MAG TPA: hypothetical protein VIL46_04695 [Gemmataceae bacterium]